MATIPANTRQYINYQSRIDAVLAKYEHRVQSAFLAAVRDIVDTATLKSIVEALEVGDITRAIAAVNIDPAVYWTMTQAITGAYNDGGAAEIGSHVWRYPDLSKAVVRWDMANTRASAWVSDLSSDLVVQIKNSQRDALRTTIEAGYSRGRSPIDIARDIMGRIDNTGRRNGGIVGLDDTKAQWVANARDDLTDLDERYFSRTLRDKRFDKIVRKAMDSGKPLTRAQIDKIVGRYADRMLQRRAEDIARTETQKAVSAAAQEALRQGKDKTGLPDNVFEKVWKHRGAAPSGKERIEHIMMHNKSVIGVDTPFVLPDNTLMKHPRDTELGAVADHTVNCRCGMFTRINYGLLAV